MVMQASGGVMTKEYIEGSPIRVLSSGPAGGVMGSAHVGRAKGYPDLLCVDMGGTSYDVSVVLDGVAPADAAWNMHHRYLIGVPMVKVETLGAGGGSICHVNKGALEVGPASAGAEPGPICYGRGGERPTITDALVMLGILSADSEFAGGSFALRTAGIEEAFDRIGAQMGYGAEEAAFDSWRVVNANMTQAVRRSTAEKGIDPTRMIMLAYGGNGPVFAAVQAQELGIDRVLVPKASPAFSALGALVANPSIDEERSYIAPATALDARKLRALWRELDQRAERYFRDANFSRQQVFAKYQMKMRYPGQNWSLTFDIKTNKGAEDLSFVDDTLGARAIEAFNKRHMDEYGHVREGEIPEVVGVRLSTYAETPVPKTAGGFTAAKVAAPLAKTRRANLGEGYRKTNVYRGADLEPGHQIIAPAIIEETFTTIVVYPGWSAQVDDAGDYQLTKLEAHR
jgi:N-methylhydantoinase A